MTIRAVGVFGCARGPASRGTRGAAPMADRGIAPGLVDDQHIAGLAAGRGRVVNVVFRQIQLREAAQFRRARGPEGSNRPRGGWQQDLLQPRRRAAVEMHAERVDQQPERRIAHATGVDRAQEGILDPDQRHAAPRGHRLAAPGIGRAAPDHARRRRAGQAKAQVVPGQRQDAAQAALAQETGVLVEKPPGNRPGGWMSGRTRPAPRPLSCRPRWPAVRRRRRCR